MIFLIRNTVFDSIIFMTVEGYFAMKKINLNQPSCNYIPHDSISTVFFLQILLLYANRNNRFPKSEFTRIRISLAVSIALINSALEKFMEF